MNKPRRRKYFSPYNNQLIKELRYERGKIRAKKNVLKKQIIELLKEDQRITNHLEELNLYDEYNKIKKNRRGQIK